jgi:hypothetical protein
MRKESGAITEVEKPRAWPGTVEGFSAPNGAHAFIAAALFRPKFSSEDVFSTHMGAPRIKTKGQSHHFVYNLAGGEYDSHIEGSIPASCAVSAIE